MSDDPFAPLSGAGRPKQDKPDLVAVVPVPPDAPSPPQIHPKLGQPAASWTYLNGDGQIIGYVHRFNQTDGEKQFRPLVLFRPSAGGPLAWRWESWTNPRPLYGLDLLQARPHALVVVAEGEKSADAARKLVPGCVVVTSPNGSKSAAKADWSPLKGRAVIIWPDADAVGLAYAGTVARLALEAGAASVAIVSPPEGVEPGWDAADALDEGWDEERVRGLLAAARPAGQGNTPENDAAAPVAASEGRKAGGTRKRRSTPRERRPTQSEKLIGLTADCDLWHGPDREALCTFPVGDHRETWPIRSSAFKQWLCGRAYDELGLVPGNQAVEDTLRVLEAKAINRGPERKPWLRVGHTEDGRLYLDLGTKDWSAIEIRSDGWSVRQEHDGPFVRSKALWPLPLPEAGYDINELRRFVNVANDDDFILVVGWLMAALRSKGPYPILVVNGEQGSGKSTFSRLLRSLVDPNAAPIRSAPKDERDLIVWASNGHVIAMDNLSKVDSELSDALCRLATGGGSSTRKLHTDTEEIIFSGARPIILNGIPMLTDRPDLAQRAVSIRLRAIAEDERQTEDDFWEAWAEVAPRVLGALCDGLSAAVRRVGTVRLERIPRLADFAKWVTAAEPGLGWEDGTFLRTYSGNIQDVADSAFEANPVAVAIHAMLCEPSCGEYGWRGTATELLDALNQRASETQQRSYAWPKLPQQLGNQLERIAPLLRSKGFHFERKHSGNRQIILTHLSR
ncbi:hypothetical protein [Microvirga sp. CF3016]|uniref:hypothetical protein n=1 Tax=Microvirga sp. CF3016 TaxID=3110181 RepID=UPI002E78A8FE|nr:hypothetical protein [Microvirga sp. CF3016]MEE1612068.1 hypothetical protein [Microvirga sp. CF3016]